MAQPHSPYSDDPRIIDSNEAFLTKNLYPLVIAVIALLALASAGTWWWADKQSKEAEALQLYSLAKTPEDLQKIVKTYPKAPATALALIDLARKETGSKNYPAALSLYQEFLKTFPHHPAAPSVELALAISEESSGKIAEARAGYNKIISTRPAHAFVGAASIGLARIYLQENNLLAARQTLTDFISTNEETGGGNQAREMLNSLPPAVK